MYWVRVGDVCTVAENVLCDGEGAEVSVSPALTTSAPLCD